MITVYYKYNNCPDIRIFQSYEELTEWLKNQFGLIERFSDTTFSITKIES